MPPVWIVLALLPILGGAERFSCRGRILGAYYADFKSGCKAFHVCVRVAGGGIRDFRFFCPPGTLFHQEAQTCTDWGDDDPLACPADLYDGQFDLYKIGSGLDTKKVSSPGNRDEESEFSLQRAESGDRRLNSAASDLRAAHSSDFFSGQRDRGRDDTPVPSSSSRQSFRRNPTTRAPHTTQYNTPQQTQTSQPPNPPQYEQKRKLVRKRPIYTKSTPNYSKNSTPQNSSPQPNYPQQFLQKQSYSQSPAPQQAFQQSTPQQPYQKPPTLQQNYPNQPSSQQTYQNQPTPQQQYQQQSPKTTPQQKPTQQVYQQTPQSVPQQPQPYNQRPANRPVNPPAPAPPAIVPPQYKEEYVEVSRVTPKKNRYYASPTTQQYSSSTVTPNFGKKEGLVELYNYDAQSTPGINQKDIRPFKVKNSFSVADIPLQQDQDFARKNVNIQPNGAPRVSPTTLDYNTAASRSYSTTTPAYKNFNSVSYDADKNIFSNTKQSYYNSPSTQSTNVYTTQRSEAPANLNTVAYNTNNGFNNIQSANYVGNDDDNDDGQYRPPHDEDDGQYRPELYERELLSGAHSLNIAASGNRLPEDQKQKHRVQQKVVAQTAAPRPFRPAPTQPTAVTLARSPETTYSTTYRPQPSTTYRPSPPSTTYRPPQASTKVTFDAYQTYTTTSRPEAPAPPRVTASNPAPRPTSPATSSRSPPPRPPQVPFVNPPTSNKEDASYDYAYYDSDTGFSEYDQIQEFGKTKKA